jgi:hypothetical protein
MLQPHVIHDLFRFPMWWIDVPSFTQDHCIVTGGWAHASGFDDTRLDCALDRKVDDGTYDRATI